MKIIWIALLTLILTLAGLFTLNYYTLFGYYLPHKSQLVYMSNNDISVRVHPPQFIVISGNTSFDELTLPAFVTDENGTWYFENNPQYEEVKEKVTQIIVHKIHEDNPSLPIETIENWVK